MSISNISTAFQSSHSLAKVFILAAMLFTAGACAQEPAKQTIGSKESIIGANKSAVTPDWMVGNWRPSRSAFGKDPWNYCILTVTLNQLVWKESPGGSSRALVFSVVVLEKDFVIVKTDSKNDLQRVCVHVPPHGYIRFDRKDYFHCIQHARETNKSIEQECPKPFSDNRSFELTVFRNLENALKDSNDPLYWSGYFKYVP